jgi:ankyrin repeat protein
MTRERSAELVEFLSDISEQFECDFSNFDTLNYSDENALHVALWSQQLELAKELIELGINLNVSGDLGRTPIHVAASQGYVDILRLMVAQDGDLFACDEGQYTPIMIAALRNQQKAVDFLDSKMKRSESLQTFIGQLGNVNDQLALKAAILEEKADLVQELVHVGADRFSPIEDGRCPLHFAAMTGDLEIVKTLIAASCFTNDRDDNEYSPLMLAELMKNEEVSQYLRKVAQQILNNQLHRYRLAAKRQQS